MIDCAIADPRWRADRAVAQMDSEGNQAGAPLITGTHRSDCCDETVRQGVLSSLAEYRVGSEIIGRFLLPCEAERTAFLRLVRYVLDDRRPDGIVDNPGRFGAGEQAIAGACFI
jgi:hypothetical protein